MTSRRIIFSNPTDLLIDSNRLSALKAKVDSIAADLATLDGQSEATRRSNKSLRNGVINAFKTLDEV